MDMADIEKLQVFLRNKDWAGAHGMLDDARNRAVTRNEKSRAMHWRVATLEREKRYEDALELLRRNADLFNSQCRVHLERALCFEKLGRKEEALAELAAAPIESEMESFYAFAIDAKFLYFYLLAESGDASVAKRLGEIPDDYRHITIDGKFLTKPDIVSLLNQT
jgi:tetratricopeptide (TPR) repeat protein